MTRQINQNFGMCGRKVACLLAITTLSMFFALSGRAATPAILIGIVTNGVGSAPVVGAKVTVNGKTAWTTTGGIYSLSVDPVGVFTVSCSKPGFENFTSAPVNFQQGVTTQMNIALFESLVPPIPVNASLDTVTQAVTITWNTPTAPYELLYDDGIQDNFTVWAQQGNMNAVKFTPHGYPVKVTGGLVNIGNSANYAAGATPGPFKINIYDALGTGGVPGASLAGPFTINPTTTGWIEFSLPNALTLNSGSFYIVMTQVGTPPSAAGLAIDETAPQFRSYSRFVTGSSQWYPAGGNFMIRARCEGTGGPLLTADNPAAPVTYSIYRLRQGEEQNPSAWTSLASQPGTTLVDNSWPSLPCGPYRWGITTLYPGNRWAAACFSNIVGKCWTSNVNIHVNVTCQPNGPAGTFLKMANMAYPDTTYSAICDTSGNFSFPRVWKGNYKITVGKFAYDTLIQTLQVTGPVNISLTIMQTTIPPANLIVNDSSLRAHWDVPHFEKNLFKEEWTGGSLVANGWTLEGGSNWQIASVHGNPAPCIIFSPTPQVLNYNQSLVSRTIEGERSTLLKFKYDILLSNAGTTTVNQMAVEIWNGASWSTLKNYSSSGGSFPWTSEELDISDYTDNSFKVRFRAYGGDSYDLSSWDLDNIIIEASDPAQQQALCILGYYFYLGNAISGYTTQNAYTIPANQVQYGQTYNACVRALYGSGYSDSICATFTSHFLYPVRNLTGIPVDNAAFLEWEKPQAFLDTIPYIPQGLIGYRIYRNNSLIAQISNVDTLSYYDNYLESGLYKYGVTAVYDLTYYGYPGQVAEAVAAGPVDVTISFGRLLPFFESWNQGTFTYNEWRFVPSQGNWFIDPGQGIPSPAAGFKWHPPKVNYSYAIESPALNGVPFNCAAIWLDFDLKLNDRNATSTEKLIVEAYYNHEWHKKAEFRNAGSFDWTNYHIDISPARGKGFRIRFRAEGTNSSELQTWYLDNISVYPVCYPAVGLAGTTTGNDIKLTWKPPACYGGNLLNEGFEGTAFPPSQWSIQSTNPASTWTHLSAGVAPGVHNGNFSAGLNWDYNHQDEWLIAHNVYVNGNLTFWSYAFQGSQHLDHYYVKVSTDQGATWNALLDMSALPPYPGPNGVNNWNTPYHIDLSAYTGETIDIAWHAIDGDGNGLWYPWAIDDCSMGADDHTMDRSSGNNVVNRYSGPQAPSALTGYDVYRKSGPNGEFLRINAVPLTDTSYLDTGLIAGQYRYYIQSLFAECTNTTNSDTVLVDHITSVPTIEESDFRIYPNPATGCFMISSLLPVSEIKLLSMDGICVGKWTVYQGTTRITPEGIPAGLYIVNVKYGDCIVNKKVCLINP